MSALAIGCIVFAAGCFTALVLRLANIGRRGSLADVLLPLLAAALAGGSYAWYAGPHTSAEAVNSPMAAPPIQDGNDLQSLASQLRGKLGKESPQGSAPARRAAGDLHDLARQLAQKLERDPGNGQGWALLARSYANIQQYDDAEKAFAKAAKLLPRDAELFVGWADTRVMAQGGKWDKRSSELLEQALATDPKNPRALSLAQSKARTEGKATAR